MLKSLGWTQTGMERNRWFQKTKHNVVGKFADNRWVQSIAARKGSILILGMAFLLGRAMILDQLAPFAVAFFAVIYFLRKELLVGTGLFLIGGSLFSQAPEHTGYMVVAMLVVLLIQKGIERFQRSDISYAPLIVFAATFFVQLFAVLVRWQAFLVHLDDNGCRIGIELDLDAYLFAGSSRLYAYAQALQLEA